jgi:hypothetical protein
MKHGNERDVFISTVKAIPYYVDVKGKYGVKVIKTKELNAGSAMLYAKLLGYKPIPEKQLCLSKR